MPKVIKEPKDIDIFVNITYEITDDYLIQKYQFVSDNKRQLEYLFDKRYNLKKK